MSDLKALLIFLSQFDLTTNKIKQVLDYLGENASIKEFKKAKFDKAKIFTSEALGKMIDSADDNLVKTFVVNLAERGIKIVCKFDDDYPQSLFDLDDAPYILYYKGDLSLTNRPCLSVVGTRKPTSYGRAITERLVRDVASAGVVIISGLAYGIDSIAHRKCLEVGGKTIAVLAGGFDHIYPNEHQGLANEIAEKGLLISEYRPKKSSTKYSFPLRNRIVAGLSKGVLITEASLKSGTIHTKDFALDYGRDVFAVPGNIDSINSSLTNEIIKRGQGFVVTEAKDILDKFGEIQQPTKTEKGEIDLSSFSAEEQQILSQLSTGMKTIDELAKNCSFSINIFNSYLTTLEISGIINRMPGGYITLN